MRREQLDEVLREVGRLSGKRAVTVIGSQAVHAVTDVAPTEVLVSLECDVLLDEGDPVADVIRRELGPTSAFHAERGLYANVVPPGLPVLPDRWRDRLGSLDAGGVIGLCLEIHDLTVAKLAAGRLKDYELVAALVARGLIDVARARDRIAGVPELRLRAILLARLQIVLESIGRGS